MIKLFRKWRADKQREHNNDQYAGGFQWAMASYYIADVDIEDIESQVEYPLGEDHYDMGIAYALHLIVGHRQRQFERSGEPNARRRGAPKLRMVK